MSRLASPFLNKYEPETYKAVWEAYPDAVIIVDHSGQIKLINHRAEEIFGFSHDKIIGENHRILFSKKDTKSLVPEMLLEKASLNGRAKHEGWLRKKDGHLFWASIVLTAIYNDRKKVMGYSTVARDLTERMKAEEMVRSQAEELQEKNKELENFTYIASHDLQEPLSTVSSMIELIREESDQFNKDTEEYFSYIEEAVDRMRILIKGLLKYSRLGRNRELVLVNVEELVDDVQVDLSKRIKAVNATIKIMDELPKIEAFSVELRLLFQNIIGNALKFHSSERTPLVKIFAKEHKSYWKFSIEDNGIGIKENYLTKIFIIFQQLHAKSQYEGEGIGLAHCKKIVDIHEGDIWAESVIGKGSIFHFTISKKLKEAAEHNLPGGS